MVQPLSQYFGRLHVEIYSIAKNPEKAVLHYEYTLEN